MKEKLMPLCPTCEKHLKAVTYPGGYLNSEQWDNMRAGDWVCKNCPDNGRAANKKFAYFWDNEVLPNVIKQQSEQEQQDTDQTYSGHTHCKKCGKVHWMHGSCPIEFLDNQPEKKCPVREHPYEVPPFNPGKQELKYFWWSWHPRRPYWSRSCWGGDTEKEAWNARSKQAGNLEYYHNKLIREGDGQFTEVFDDPCRCPEVWRDIANQPRKDGDATPILDWISQPEQQQQDSGEAPATVYIQLDDDAEKEEYGSEKVDGTWCIDQIFPQDVAYVKLADVLPLLEAIKQEVFDHDHQDWRDINNGELFKDVLTEFLAKHREVNLQ